MYVPSEQWFLILISDASDEFALLIFQDAGEMHEYIAFDCGSAGNVSILLNKRIELEPGKRKVKTYQRSL